MNTQGPDDASMMTLLAMYADHDTGANARPSMRLLQDLSHYKHSTVRAALDVAQQAGYITASGTWTPTKGGDPITVWALGYPTAEGFVPWGVIEDESASSGPSTDPVEEVGGAAGRSHRSPESVVPLDGTTDTTVGGAAGRNHRTDPVEEVGGAAGRNVGGAAGRNVGGAAGRHTTSSTSRPLGREEEEEERGAPTPAPKGAAPDAPTPVVGYLEAVQALEAQLRQQWPERFSFRITGKTRSALRALLDNGWTLEQLLTLTAEVPEPKSNPAGLLQKHYARALDDADPADYTPVVHADDAPTSQATAARNGAQRRDYGTPKCMHGRSLNQPPSSCQECNEIQQAIDALRADAEARGFIVRVENSTYVLSSPTNGWFQFDATRVSGITNLILGYRFANRSQLSVLFQYGDPMEEHPRRWVEVEPVRGDEIGTLYGLMDDAAMEQAETATADESTA